MKKISKRLILIVVFLVLLTGCTVFTSNGQADQDNINTDLDNNKGENNENNNNEDNDKDIINDDNGKKDTDEDDIDENDGEDNSLDDLKEKIDLSLKPNEAGQIMVLMYHGIGETEATWTRTPENFKRDLETLYEKGYRAISLKDYVNNNINVEEGYTPVVFTFDDGLKNNFNIIDKDGEKIIDPNCAIGIMEEFKKSHPDFNMTASFFVYGGNPFRQSELIEYKLNWLIENGYDIGNHTVGHNNMSEVSDSNKIQEYIGKEAAFLESFLDGYKIDTYALAYGARPDKELQHLLEQGEYQGEKYKNIAILNVGWDPYKSPIDKDFNPLSIHRVRASETNVDNVGLYNWLEVFDKYPHRRFISDGQPKIVTVPQKYESKVDEKKLQNKELYVYESK